MSKAYTPFKDETLALANPLTIFSRASSPSSRFMGITRISSNTANQHAIPATAVGTASHIALTLRSIVVGSESVPQLTVTSINPGTGFVISTVQSWALQNSYNLSWFVINRG